VIDIEDLYTAARDTNTLLPRVMAHVPDTGTVVESQIGSHGKAPAAPLPWNDTFAMCGYGIRDDARRHETNLTLKLYRKAKFRPGTDEHVREAITRLPILIAHARDTLPDIDQPDVETIARDLAAWPRRCRHVLDELLPDEQPWTKAPGDLCCPYCDHRLELAPGWSQSPANADLVCRRCRTEDGGFQRWAPTQWTGHVLGTDPGPTVDEDGVELVTAVEAATRCGVPAGTVRVWDHRGQVVAVGRNRRGAKLYRITDLQQRAERSEIA